MIILYVILGILVYLILTSFTALIFLKSSTPFTPREAYTAGLFWPLLIPIIIMACIIGQVGLIVVGIIYNRSSL